MGMASCADSRHVCCGCCLGTLSPFHSCRNRKDGPPPELFAWLRPATMETGMDDRGQRPWEPSRHCGSILHDWVVVNCALTYANLWERHKWLTSIIPDRQIHYTYSRPQRVIALLTTLLLAAAIITVVASRNPQDVFEGHEWWWCFIAAVAMLPVEMALEAMFVFVDTLQSETATTFFWERLRWKISACACVMHLVAVGSTCSYVPWCGAMCVCILCVLQ